MISGRIAFIRNNITRVCQKIGRNPQEITVVGVTKFATVENIKEAVAAGVTDIGENRVQAAREKFPLLSGLAVRRHMIGHLQTNKVKLALELFDMIQSVDSFPLAEEIQKQAERQARVVDILVQVDCAGEVQKFGVPKDEALALIAKIQELKNINIQGLMTIAPFVDSIVSRGHARGTDAVLAHGVAAATDHGQVAPDRASPDDETVIRACFRDLRLVRDQVNQKFARHERVTMKYLSMGMTHDYLIALEEGANMLRIGTAIFAGKEE